MMNSVSKAAVAAGLMMAAGLAMVPAATAQQQQVRVSAAFRTPAAAANTALQARDAATAEPHVAAAEAAAASDDEKYFAAQLRYDLETLKRNDAGRAAALDAMIASPKLPPAAAPSVHFVRGQLANVLRKPADAVRFLTRARELGSTNPDLPLQLAIALFETNNLQGGVAEIESAIRAREAAGQKAPEDWYKFVVSKLYTANDRAGAATWLMRQIRAWPSPNAWRSAVLVYMERAQAQGTVLDKANRIDLYRLIRAARGLAGESDYFDYAKAAQETGLPAEAVAVLNEGRAAGRVSAGNAAVTQLLTTSTNAVRADIPLETLDRQARAAATGRLAAQTGDAYLAAGNHAKAIELYQLALTKGGAGVDVDSVTLHLGIAQVLSGDRAAGKTTLDRVTAGPRGEIARFWGAFAEVGGGSATPAAPAAAPAPAGN